MKDFTQIFLKGLLAILPLMLTIFVFLWLTKGLEIIFGSVIRILLPNGFYVPGMGIVIGLVFIYGLGLLLQSWAAQRLQSAIEKTITKFPLVGNLYRSIEGMTHYFAESENPEHDQVVMVKLENEGSPGLRLLGLVTYDDFKHAPSGMGDEETIAVYLPWSYQMGGFTIYLPRSSVTPVAMSKKEAFRWALTGGVDGSIKK